MAKINMRENVTHELRDKNGKIKPLWKANFLGRLTGLQFPFMGKWVDKLVVSNIITDAGRAAVAARMMDNGTEAQFDYIAIGTDATAEAVGDTALGAEVTTGGGARAQGTTQRITTDTTNDTLEVILIYTFSSSFALREVGLFNAASGGTMLARQVHGQVSVNNLDQYTVTWRIDVD